MQQIFNFILKTVIDYCFSALGISLSLRIQSHSFHRSKIISSANFLSGGVYEKINNVNEYLNLKTQNDALHWKMQAKVSYLIDTTALKIRQYKGVNLMTL
jgi:rod shape-determining protein MreC